ncbi:hypothetical protein SAMN05660443_1337 [Marinospirillum celere]|uniref:DUF5610 domain-containing protein n=1 Tax=Marinospirillum celere TaxID=1122252 RepID=A0A1I1G1V1_9GAMM|nr:DUF5610 domain-containing protein [Marinospirillum celere]SFC05296.1 hypothetical protein SAMN05660443_1337 [Marinospirillum celere]
MSSENLSISSAPVTTPGQANPPKARAAEVLDAKRTDAPEVNTKERGKDWAQAQAESRLEANAGLLQAMFGKADSRGANAQKINYQEVVIKLEEVLRKELGDDNFSLEKLAAKTSGVEGQEDYWSPEKTADRIVTGATGYFEAFKKQNPSLSEEEALDKFMDIITPAIDRGFNQAKEILQGFEIFKGDVQENAERTLELVHEKLDLFRERVLGSKEDKPLFDDTQGLEDKS